VSTEITLEPGSFQSIAAQQAQQLQSPQPVAAVGADPVAGPAPTTSASATASASAAASAASASFVAANYPQIVTGVHGQLLPSGGEMHIRLSPVELGDLQISVQVRDGAISASFQTSNDQATKLLSHNLGQLKTALESAGASVEKLQVSQTSRDNPQTDGDSSDGERPPPSEEFTRDQQRREMLRRMWRNVSGGDPLDMVA
jgi:flagellar hook-length control protein FliK